MSLWYENIRLYMAWVESIFLENFRNFKDYRLDLQGKGEKILLLGQNGVGKTNILEAVSMLTPGSGIRGSKLADQVKVGESLRHMVCNLHTHCGLVTLTDDYDLIEKRRTVTFNDRTIKANELKNLCDIVWITPSQNTLFVDSPQLRRKYLDRHVYLFNSQHADEVTRYEHYYSERMKILRESGGVQSTDINNTLDMLEEKIATHAIQLTSNRQDTIQMLQNYIDRVDSPYPKCTLQIECDVAKLLQSYRVEVVKGRILEICAKNRGMDMVSHKTNFGPHRSDFFATHETGMLAKYCSTGQQQAILISIVVSVIHASIEQLQYKPIALLDETFVHLDSEKQAYLADLLQKVPVQTWVTATDNNCCVDYSKFAEIIQL